MAMLPAILAEARVAPVERHGPNRRQHTIARRPLRPGRRSVAVSRLTDSAAGDGTLRPGRIVASHGPRVVVEDEAGRRHACRLFGRRLQAVCGDDVQWTPASAEGAGGLVQSVAPRRSQLARTSLLGEAEVIVANLDQIVAVLAPLPAPDFGLCDRYLAAAEWAGLAAAVVMNKADLAAAADPALAAELRVYQGLGYPTVASSKRLPRGVDDLRTVLGDKVSVLVGQSGVGKSSLLNELVPGVEATVQEISQATEEGRHTTTASALYHLPGGGELIDSPGVRDFAPPLPAPRDVATGFREIAAASQGCRFPDCRHVGEPGCAVEPLAADGRIWKRRLSSYRQLYRLACDFEERRRTGAGPAASRRRKRVRK